MLSQTTEHAIRGLLYLAQRPAGETASADRMARALGAPANYLGKTLNQLARHGVLVSTRGPLGGFRLARDPEEITLAEVTEIFAEPRSRAHCLMGDRPCSERNACPAHAHWVELGESLAAPLRSTTIADLLKPHVAAERDEMSPNPVLPAA